MTEPIQDSEAQVLDGKEDREAWLNTVVQAMTPWFTDLGFPLAELRLSTGFPSTGGRSRDIAGTIESTTNSPATILVRPDRNDSMMVAAALAHQLARLAAGDRDVHGLLYRHIAISIGLPGRKTESPAGQLFEDLIKPVLDRIGPLPTVVMEAPGKELPQKQKSRLIKVHCLECGYVARVSRKWLNNTGPPHCPAHGSMRIAE